MFSPIASTIFTYRNFEKTENGEIGRAPVFIGQAAGVLSEVAKYDNALAVGAKNVLSIFSDLAEGNKALTYAGKFAKFASENVNPLIAVSGGVKVLMSEDKQSTAITEASALAAMFTGEGLVKSNYDKIVNSNKMKSFLNAKHIKPIVEFLEKKNIRGVTGSILKGILFVAASMSSYEIGHIAGDKLAKQVKKYQVDDNTTVQEAKKKLENTETKEIPLDFSEKINQVA